MLTRVKNIILTELSEYKWVLILFPFFSSISIVAQTNFVIIHKIDIVNNHNTKDYILFHELDFKAGDTISIENLSSRMQSNERRIKSIGLFNHAAINIKHWNTDINSCDIEISVIENWFIYPYIIFELADRNFNVWRREFNYSLKRVNFGIAGNHINLTGNKDKLKLKVQGGYVRKLEAYYDYPYIWGNWGIAGNLLYAENRELAYITQHNKPLFFKQEDNNKVQFLYKCSAAVSQRISPYMNQSFRLEFNKYQTDAEVAKLNPDYLGHGKSTINFFYLDYSLKYDHTEYPLYPLKGYRFELNARKEGLGIFKDVNNAWISLNIEQHFRLTQNLILSARIKFKTNFQPDPVPYILSNAIGYKNDFLTGYQLYVMDGKHFMLTKHALRYRIFDKNLNTPSFLPRQFSMLNVQLFSRINLDAGYSFGVPHDRENLLNNSIQLGYGMGFDLILFNNFIASADLGITRQCEAGLFFSGGFNF